MENNEDIFLFIGRFHPVLVHLPIGMLLLAFIFALFSRKKQQARLVPAIPVALAFGAVAALITSVSGFFLSRHGGYNTDTLSLHRWLGIAASLASFWCWMLYKKPDRAGNCYRLMAKFRFVFLTAMIVLLSLAGHFGGMLTHGEGYLTAALPQGIRQYIKQHSGGMIIENIQEAAVFEDVISPIFQQRCQSCHGTKKQEGKLALNSIERLVAGGESGPVVIAGNAGESELYRRLVLPQGHEKRMPPKGRPPISTEQVKLIEWWINSGMPAGIPVKDLEQPDEVRRLLLSLEQSTDGNSDDVPPADSKAAEKLIAKGIKVAPVGAGKNRLVVSALNYPEFNDEDFSLLAVLGRNVVQLELGNTRITDSALRDIHRLTDLQQLHLQHTRIGDSGIAYLRSCRRLRNLNLVNTRITNAGALALSGLPDLHKIYLFMTATTADGIAALQRRNPGLVIDTGNHYLPLLSSDTTVYR